MGIYRKKPVEVEAHIFTGTSTSASQIGHWMESGVYRERGVHTRDIMGMEIETREGIMIAAPGDYIIKGVHGEFYPCKPDIFHDSYEIVEEQKHDN